MRLHSVIYTCIISSHACCCCCCCCGGGGGGGGAGAGAGAGVVGDGVVSVVFAVVVVKNIVSFYKRPWNTTQVC